MKKHPFLKYLLILLVSGTCGALVSRLVMNFEDGIVGAIQSLSNFFAPLIPVLHISICLILSLTAIYLTLKIKRSLDSVTAENEDEICEQAEKQCSPVMILSVLCTICNFFFLGASIVYKNPRHILISAAATIVFLSLNTWIEVSQISLVKKINPKFKDTDPMSMRFMKDWEKNSDEAETFEMYRAGYHSYKNMKYLLLFSFAACCMVQVFYPIGLASFILIAIFWGVHSLSYISACSKRAK